MYQLPLEPGHDEPKVKRSNVFIFIPLMFVLGITLPILVFLGVMQSTGWSLPQLGANAAFSSVTGTSNRVILYASPSSKTFFSSIGGNYDTLLTPWRLYFASRKLDFKELNEVSQLRKLKEGVLILPSAVALSADERVAIAAFRANGGSLLTTWATGSRNGRGDWEGWQFLGDLGVKMTGELPSTAETNHLTLNGESPVSKTLPAGQRIWMSKTSEALLRFSGEMVAGRFMNWARVIDDTRRGEGAIIFSETTETSARAVSYAFSENSWESRPLAIYDLLDDSIQWLSHEPMVIRAAWPDAKRASQIIEMDTEEGFANALPFAAMMQTLDYRPTFYVLTSVAKLFPEVLAKLARDFEVGYHADTHDGFKGQPVEVQEKRIQTMRTDLDAMLIDTKGMTGFRAPTESYDATTERLLHKYGIRHHTADPQRTENRLPIFAKFEGVEPGESLVVLPRTQRDDINLYWQKLTPEQTTSALIDDFDLTAESGALGLLSVHSQNFSTDSVLSKAMPGFIEHAKRNRNSVWFASAGQVADWWRDRERFKFSSTATGKRVDINITITGSTPVSGASLVVMLPQKNVITTVKSLKTGAAKLTVSKIDDYRAAVLFETLKPGNYAYQAIFSKQ